MSTSGAASSQHQSAEATVRVEIVVEQLRRSVPGGIGTYCRGLLSGIAALPADGRPAVTLRASRPRPATGRRDELAELGYPLRSSVLPGAALTRVWDRGVPLGWMRARAGGGGAVVHGTSFATPPVRGRPVVLTVHDLAWRQHPEAYPGRGRAWHEHALRRMARVARAFVVPSALTASDLLAAGVGIDEGAVRVIPEGADHLAPPDDAGAARILATAGLEAGRGYLLAVGTLEPRKNLRRLVEAYASALPRLPERWPLVVVGPRGWGSQPSPGNCPPEVVFAGAVAAGALTSLYRAARCLAYVPLYEGFGLPAAEAMSQGTPVVATRGLPSTAGTALEVDPYDVAGVADALVVAASDGPERHSLAEAGRRHASQLTWQRCAAAHAALWAEVAGA